MTNTITKRKLSVKAQTIGGAAAVITAVALPQLLHVLGAVSEHGSAFGEMLLPMHLPIILAGLLAGSYAAGAAGLLSPLISYCLTGMPASAMLPFMMIELAVYGICSGALREKNMPCIAKVFIAQLSGRIVRAAAILIGFYGFSAAVAPAVIISSIKTGIMGILLQLVLIPVIVRTVKKADNE